MERLVNALAGAARLLLAALFIHEGWQKIGASADVAGYMESHGVPGPLLPLVILTELGGGLLVAAGLATRFAAFTLAGFCLLAALIFHGVGDPDALLQFEKDVAIAGGFLSLTAIKLRLAGNSPALACGETRMRGDTRAGARQRTGATACRYQCAGLRPLWSENRCGRQPFFFGGVPEAGVPFAKGDGAATASFGFFGFLVSRLLRIWPLAIELSCGPLPQSTQKPHDLLEVWG